MKAMMSRNRVQVFSVRCSVWSQSLFWKVLMLVLAVFLTACGGPRAGSRPEVRKDAYYHRMITSGHGAFERGDISRAAELYENALIRAQLMDRPEKIGASAYNLALSRIALGALDEGRGLLQEARAELLRAGESGVDTLIAEAEVTRRLGDTEAALQLTDEAVAALEGVRARAMRVQLHALRALLALDRDDAETAVEELALAERPVRRATPLRLCARLAEVQGRLYLQEGEARLAAQEFDLETMYYRNDGRFPDMARAMARAAAAYHEAGDSAMAARHYYRAARHHAAAEQPVDALRLVEQALPALEAADDPDLAARVTALFEELTKTVKNKRE